MSAFIDLTGQRFDRLLVLQRGENAGQGKSRWDCRCDCGKITSVTSSQLRSGRTRSCGCLKRERTAELRRVDIAGQRFGRLVALEPLPGRDADRRIRWLCQCDCGNETAVPVNVLRTGHTKSCGCYLSRVRTDEARRLDLAGKRSGRLVAIEEVGADRHKRRLWRCVCDCGNEIAVAAPELNNGHRKSCGCMNTPEAISERLRIDLRGRRFHRLVAVEDVGKNRHGGRRWRCLCDCGNETTVSAGVLLQGDNTRSCGCLKTDLQRERNRDVGRSGDALRAIWAIQYDRDGISPNELRKLRIEINGGQEPYTRRQIWDRDGGMCWICEIGADPNDYDIDHLRQIVLGGQDNPCNVAVAHPLCNVRRPHDIYQGVKYCLRCELIGHPMSDHDNVFWQSRRDREIHRLWCSDMDLQGLAA